MFSRKSQYEAKKDPITREMDKLNQSLKRSAQELRNQIRKLSTVKILSKGGLDDCLFISIRMVIDHRYD